MALVLYTGWDLGLVATHTLILRSSGHEVYQASTQDEVVSKCAECQFDVAVMCQSVPYLMKRVIALYVREHCPDVKILELYQANLGKVLGNADSWLEVPGDSPHVVAERVSELAKSFRVRKQA